MGEKEDNRSKTALDVSTSNAPDKQQTGGAPAGDGNLGSETGDGGVTVKNHKGTARAWVQDNLNIIIPVKPKRNASAGKVTTVGNVSFGSTGTGALAGEGKEQKTEPLAPEPALADAPATVPSKTPASTSTAPASITPAPPSVPGGADNAGASAERKEPPPKKHPKPPEHVESLKKAIRDGKNPQVQKILQDHSNLVNEKIGSNLGTAVHYVIRNGSGSKGAERERLDLLRIIDTVPDVDWNATDNTKRTPLHLACSHTRNYGDIAEFLLDHGANPNLLDGTDCSPLHDTVTEGQKDMVSLLLADQQTNPSTPGHNQRTALHKAAYRGHLDIATLLLANDPDIVDLKDGDGYTPLHDASRQNKPEMVEKLIEAGADVNARTKSGATPLHLAASTNAVEAAKVLLRADAWTFFTNNAKETPEKVAERKGHTAMLDMLRIPVDVDDRLAGGGKDLHISEPTPSQQTASKHLDGFIWPSLDGRSKFDKQSVFDMLYAEEPTLKKVDVDKDVRWIHIPSNNRIWIEDVFKLVFSSEKRDQGNSGPGNNANGKAKAQDVRTPEQAEKLRSLKGVLFFVNTQLSEFDASSQYRHPHFEISYASRPGSSRLQMFSLMFPVVDADMQQPVYFDPNPTPPFESNPASKADGEMDDKHKDRASKLEELERAYPGTPSKSRTLDGYMHEFIDERDLNFRNGDQVVSRFVERIRCDTWRSMRPSQQLTIAAKEPAEEGIGARRRKRRNSSGTIAPAASGTIYDKTESRDFKTHGSELLKTAEPAVEVAEDTWERTATPSQLENQNPTPRRRSRRVLVSRIWQHFRNMLAGHVRSELKQLPPLTVKGLKERIAEPQDQMKKNEDEPLDSDDDEETDPEPKDKRIRQQILTVPELWILAVGGIVVTSFPEGWRVTDGKTLSQSILTTVLTGRSSNNRSGVATAAGLVSDIVMAALDFEPTISTFGSNRSFLDALSVEVAFASSKVTKSYENFKTTLGKTLKIFPDAIKQETELLVRVDDIVNEISMIKRVQQDQDHACVSMRISQAQRGPNNKKKGKGNGEDWGSRTSMNAPHERAIDRGMNDMRSAKSQHAMARLRRLEEDALRVRKSIITLLDLRQRQATTENAISSGRQSDLLFAQSKVLFVFTAATVIFAPLSWVSSLMALNIDQFSPGKDESWPRGGVFGASFSSVVCTLVLCIVSWAWYDWRVKKRDKKAETAENAGKQGR